MVPGALSGGLGQGGWTVPSPSSRRIKEQRWSVSGRLLATRDPCLRDPRPQHTPTPGETQGASPSPRCCGALQWPCGLLLKNMESMALTFTV